MRAVWFLASTFAFLSMAAAPSAHAFCRTMTGKEPNDPPKTNRCEKWNAQVEGSCCPHGRPLYWKNACVGFSLQKDASRQVSLNDAENAIIQAFAKWTGTTCPTDGTGPSRVSIDVRYLGPVTCGTPDHVNNGPNQNVIVFRDGEWNHADSNNTLGLTIVQYEPATGEIVDADMELNTAQQVLTVNDPIPPSGYDLASIVTHEVGHFLGLAHSLDEHATMFAQYRPGSTHMRNLTADDVSGICNTYLPNGERAETNPKVSATACDPTPRGGYSLECATEDTDSCSVSPLTAPGAPRRATEGDDGRSSGLPGVAASLAVLGLVLARRKSAKTPNDKHLSS